MKRTLVIVFAVFIVLNLCATITPFVQRGMGHFAGNMATYSNGNTIAMVYNDNQSGDQSFISSIVYKYSTNGGQTWANTVVDAVWGNFTQPTMSVNNDGHILVSYNVGISRKLAKSTNAGQTWTIMNMGSNFEKAPYTEQRGNEYYSFELDLPYPEQSQHVFSTVLDSELLFPPQFTTDKEISWNQTPVYYHGGDVIYGAVRTNSNIWIKRTNLGTNGGWPIFYAPVITSGTVMSQEAIPYTSIFLGGLIMNAPKVEFVTEHPDYGSGATLGPPEYDPNTIVYVSVNNMTYQAWLGTISDPIPQTAEVYSTYPASPLGTVLYTNQYATQDTVWTFLTSGSAANANFFVNNKLWIKGNFYGNHTWSSSDTIMIVGDILLSGTPANTAPDISTSPNTRDYVKLIAAKNIVIKYGYTDPQTGARVHPNCRADNNPVNIYAALYTLSHDPDNIRKDGCFTFEYQHPHSSTPSYTMLGSTFHNIDLHRYRFPQTQANPWLPQVDLPWYNPLWPESSPYMERGVLLVWGNIMQRRRGYVHRNWLDTEYNTNGFWNPAIDACGGASFYSGMTGYDPVLGEYMTPVNFPGTVGSGIGYKKDYRGDRRLGIDERLWSFGLRLGSRFSSAGEFDSYYLKKYAKRIREKVYATNVGVRAYAVNDILVTETQDLQFDLSEVLGSDGNVLDMALGDDGLWVMQLKASGNQYRMKLRSMVYHSGEILADFPYIYVNTKLNAIASMPGGPILLVRVLYDNGYYLDVSRITTTGELVSIGQYTDPLLLPSDILNRSRLYARPAGTDMLDLFFYKESTGGDPENPHGLVYHARATLSGLPNEENTVPTPTLIALSAYPNPMQSKLNVSLEATPGSTYKLDIYNLRGQKVRSLAGSMGTESLKEEVWDGRDERGTACGRGIYYLRLSLDGKQLAFKMISKL